ncbi:MAG: Nif3-like dinuclear metal center hexameric protein [Chitinophagia bacterium]|nr:Nif3-like dinuclear metal center hexameric protein [Chitinophagia bacterium]
MKLSEIISVLEAYAPKEYQESYDNCGLQVGDLQADITAALLTLDVTEEIITEAIEKGANLIVAHHPVIFGGIKSITGKNFVERTLLLAIRHSINIYCAHTNLDNMHNGVNLKIAEKLGLSGVSILSPKQDTLEKLHTYVPATHTEVVLNALFAAGAGSLGKYTECSFTSVGVGSFRPATGSKPFIGDAGGSRALVAEEKIEVLVPIHLKNRVLKALHQSHPYEEVAHEWIAIRNANPNIGAGAVGNLPSPMDTIAFLRHVQLNLSAQCIRHTAWEGKTVQRVALCGGSGSFLLRDAIAAGADAFVTADFKYHQFFEAEGRLMITDIGHFESEQFTPEIFKTVLNEKFPNFAVLLSDKLTNPVNYFC